MNALICCLNVIKWILKEITEVTASMPFVSFAFRVIKKTQPFSPAVSFLSLKTTCDIHRTTVNLGKLLA